ncbi:MAG: hypothetical protein EF806_00675 [Candidatus Methanoliparum thermophilum]|uniref:4Fe-4S ferredoxin-type domain-containing protein n=1 Tax=Methanoliparum thermophilum TaxID=2491083 RepID=A0A520KUR5_METT2|nr:Coenzyme F420 hydrogenase/dehydrogenase, beta subunit C-terminal domain [Candidatus Methanoliparum sp. LAM-1]RZN65441.1 MAG: hypothetical protein EF806_00675 [Candidatus Methanoliparum thermophilum]BDC35470.1 F420H2 dehydrogenase subunit F [Candidatus Methanoliparum sp. LAM-1]
MIDLVRLKDVVSSGRCTGCAACTIACTRSGIEVDEFAIINEELCRSCDTCGDVCPVIGGSPVDEFDNIIAVYKSRSNNIEGQNGATVSGILNSLFEAGEIDAVIGVERDEEWKASPVVITNKKDISRIAGTKYTYVPIFKAFKDAVNEGFTNIAIVGTPCQVNAARRIKNSNITSVKDKISVIIGLFCLESFYYDGLCKQVIEKELGIDLKSVKKMEVSKGKFIVMGDDEKSIPVKDLGKYVRLPCHKCVDFSAYYADISVGSAGAPDGWNTSIVRTERGIKVLDISKNDLEIEEGSIDAAKKLSDRKRKMAKEK